MVRQGTGLFAWFWLGVVLAEVLNDSGLIPFDINVLSLGGIVSFLFLISELGLKTIQKIAHSAKGVT